MAQGSVSVREIPSLPLFDPAADESPPRDAIELYVETPVSLGVYYTAVHESVVAGHISGAQGRRESTAILAAREAGIEALLSCLRSDGSFVKVGQHHPVGRDGRTVGLHLPGHLSLTRVQHLTVPPPAGAEDDETARLHDHLYIGAYGPCADEDGHHEEKGRLWPVDLLNLRGAVQMAVSLQLEALEKSLVASLGVAWEYPSDVTRHRYRELIDPLFIDLEDYDRWYCPGPARSPAWQGPSPTAYETLALGQEPDATEERVAAIRRSTHAEYAKKIHNRRMIARDVLYPPPRCRY